MSDERHDVQNVVVAEEAAAVDVPVFIGVGERDVCPDPWAEPASYRDREPEPLATRGVLTVNWGR